MGEGAAERDGGEDRDQVSAHLFSPILGSQQEGRDEIKRDRSDDQHGCENEASKHQPVRKRAGAHLAFVAGAAALGISRALGRLERGRARSVAGALVLGIGILGHLAILRTQLTNVVGPEIAPWTQQDARVVELHALAAEVPPDAAVMADYGTVHVVSGRANVYCYQQQELDPVAPSLPFTDPLLPAAPVQPTWAIVHVDHPDWAARARAAGLREARRGAEWVLFGPG